MMIIKISIGLMFLILFILCVIYMPVKNKLCKINLDKKINIHKIKDLDNKLDNHDLNSSQKAYILATIYHETDGTFEPIEEYGKGLNKKYGTAYYGRGYVQITWKENYKKFSQLLNLDLVKNPALTLNENVAFNIMIIGMINGYFTGKKLNDYINEHKKDYVGARRVINGNDKAKEISDYAKQFERLLEECN